MYMPTYVSFSLHLFLKRVASFHISSLEYWAAVMNSIREECFGLILYTVIIILYTMQVFQAFLSP